MKIDDDNDNDDDHDSTQHLWGAVYIIANTFVGKRFSKKNGVLMLDGRCGKIKCIQ